MIGRIAGTLVLRAEDHVVIDTGGVGYVVHVSDRTLAALPPAGGEAALWTDLLVREDLLQLYGFPTLAEREWHRLLQTVQGVGAKAALSMLGALGADGVARAVAMGDATALRSAPGVGPKLAQRVAMELRGKAPALMLQAAADGPPPPAPAPARRGRGAAAPPAEPAAPAATAEALSALANLGYGPAEAARAVAEAAGEDPAAATPALIRAALKRLAPRG
jgi:Holliday junction DNA helicase RuvA